MLTYTIHGYEIHFIEAIIALLVGYIIAFFITWHICRRKKRNSNINSFSQIKDKLLQAYEGNRTSATVLRELFEMFGEIEEEMKQ